jgi:hypothetical protein
VVRGVKSGPRPTRGERGTGRRRAGTARAEYVRVYEREPHAEPREVEALRCVRLVRSEGRGVSD